MAKIKRMAYPLDEAPRLPIRSHPATLPCEGKAMAIPQILLPAERITQAILLVRGGKVILDVDLAALYGVPTKRLNEQVKRNVDRFPDDFAFRLSSTETTELVAFCDRFKGLKHSTVLPLAFTEHGAIAAAFVLNSPQAVQVSVQVVRAFVQLRQMVEGHQELARRIADLERRTDTQFQAVFEALRGLMEDSHTHGPAVSLAIRRRDPST